MLEAAATMGWPETMTVAVVRDQPNSASMDFKNRLNESMPDRCYCYDAGAEGRTMLRERGMREQRDLDSYVRSTRKSPQDGKKIFRAGQKIGSNLVKHSP
jgi:hypothetical protein